MRWRHALVVAVALLAISAQPVAAQNAPAVASSHTTASDFQAATELSSVAVEGTGTSASVAYEFRDSVTDGFEDGDLAKYSGDTGQATVQANTVYAGSNALKFQDPNSNDKRIFRTDTTVGQGDTFKTRVYLPDSKNQKFLFGVQDVNNYYVVEFSGTDLIIGERAGGSKNNLQTSSWSETTGEWLDLTVDWDRDGTIKITVDDATGSQVGAVETVSNSFSSGGYGYGSFDGVAYFDRVEDPSRSGTYISEPHTTEDIETGWANLSLTNTSAAVTWQEDADNDGTWTNVTSATYSTTGNYTADLSATTSERWRTRVDFATTGDSARAELHDEGLLFNVSSPTLSDPEPPNEAKIQNAVGEISVNVTDPYLNVSQGNSVTVSATDGNGNSIGSTTLSSNGTASLAYTPNAGENTIQWTATNEYGGTDTITQTFTTPGVIEVRNESAPGTIISSASNITATFYGADGTTVVQKSSPNGTIPIAGVPTNTEYVVAVNANGYRPRRVRLTNLFDQQSVYLLPETANSANIQFELNDRTGNFPSDSELIISKPITENGSTAYVDIAADSFGATGSTRFILEDNSRYLLRVKSPDGDVREIGAYTTAGAAVEPIPIGRVSVGSTIDSGSALQTGYISENGQTYLRVTYADPDNRTESLTYKIVNETGAVIEPERTVSVTGEYRATIPVNSTDAATVNYSYTRQTEAGLVTTSGNASVGGLPGIARTWPIDQQVLSLSGYLLIVGVTGLLVIRDPGVASIAGTVVASLLTFIGVVAIPYMALGVAGVTAVLFNVGRVR